uniref:Transmembrane protein 205 n=1 Tax=Monodelphis domestica TaxID=13616 RepID=A0A5F8HHJ2_MONDO
MPTDAEPSVLAKTLHLVFLSTFWGMQIWVTFISGGSQGGFYPCVVRGIYQSPSAFGISSQSRLYRFYYAKHISMLFFFFLNPYLLSWRRYCLIIFFVCVIVSALNAQWFGQMTSDIMADMHLIEQSYGLGQDIGFFSRKSYTRLRDSNPKYRQLSSQLNRYRFLSSLCNLGCLACNGFSLCHMATNLSTL